MENDTNSSFKEKALFEHKLKVRQIIIDKALWAFVLIILGITTNIIWERYKDDIAKNRFFLEKKYDSAVAIQESLSNLISQFDRFTRIDLISTLPKESSEIFLDALAKFITENNKASLLISEEFREKGNYFTQIFSGFHHKNIIKCNEYREFGIDVGAWLNEALLKEMNFTVSFYKDDYQFKGINQESFFKIEREIGAERFLDNEFLKWKEWRKKHKGK